jgi:hypothetical protein
VGDGGHGRADPACPSWGRCRHCHPWQRCQPRALGIYALAVGFGALVQGEVPVVVGRHGGW